MIAELKFFASRAEAERLTLSSVAEPLDALSAESREALADFHRKVDSLDADSDAQEDDWATLVECSCDLSWKEFKSRQARLHETEWTIAQRLIGLCRERIALCKRLEAECRQHEPRGDLVAAEHVAQLAAFGVDEQDRTWQAEQLPAVRNVREVDNRAVACANLFRYLATTSEDLLGRATARMRQLAAGGGVRC